MKEKAGFRVCLFFLIKKNGKFCGFRFSFLLVPVPHRQG